MFFLPFIGSQFNVAAFGGVMAAFGIVVIIVVAVLVGVAIALIKTKKKSTSDIARSSCEYHCYYIGHKYGTIN